MKLVRLNLTDEEYKAALDKAIENGFVSIQEYLRYLLLDEQPEDIDYEGFLSHFESYVSLLKSDVEFRVKDCFDPVFWGSINIQNRRNLGRMIFRKVEKGGWLPIVPTRKDSANAQWYKKIDDGSK
jgi:hypothetical protein